MDLTIFIALIFGAIQIYTVHKLFMLWGYCFGAQKRFKSHADILDMHNKILDVMMQQLTELQKETQSVKGKP